VRQNTSGRGELLNFLKGETHTGIDWTKNVDVSEVQRTHQLKGKNLAVQQVSYELSGLNGHVSDPIVIEEGGRRYKFKNVLRTSNDEAIAEELVIEQL